MAHAEWYLCEYRHVLQRHVNCYTFWYYDRVLAYLVVVHDFQAPFAMMTDISINWWKDMLKVSVSFTICSPWYNANLTKLLATGSSCNQWTSRVTLKNKNKVTHWFVMSCFILERLGQTRNLSNLHGPLGSIWLQIRYQKFMILKQFVACDRNVWSVRMRAFRFEQN